MRVMGKIALKVKSSVGSTGSNNKLPFVHAYEKCFNLFGAVYNSRIDSHNI